jgi:heptosyltransferase III
MRRLLIRPGAIGDIITSLPALECLRGDHTEIWAPTALLPLLKFADTRRSIASTGLELLELGLAPAGVLEALRGFDSIVSWYGSNRDEFRAALAGLPVTFFRALPTGAQHAVDFYLAQAHSMGAEGCEGTPRVRVKRSEGGFAVIHPFSGSKPKNWPLENFRSVAAWLARRMPVNWCAGPEEPLPEAVRFEDLGDLAWWLAEARVYIGNDSGITHLAAATGTRVVAIFEASDPQVWAPRGERVSVLERPSVDDVIRLLAETDG